MVLRTQPRPDSLDSQRAADSNGSERGLTTMNRTLEGKESSMKVDIGIQVGRKEAQAYRNVEQGAALEIIARAAPGMAERLRTVDERLSLVRKEITADPDMAVEYYMVVAAQARADNLLNCDLNGRSPKDQIARINQYHRYAGVGSALLYKDINFRGGTAFFTLTWPNFKWWPYKFNDVASSAKAWGANILFEHSWYGGRPLYLIGVPYVEFPDFRKFGFNDIASSFASIG
jgi:hypothetical protein